jgi:hypothetical protein
LKTERGFFDIKGNKIGQLNNNGIYYGIDLSVAFSMGGCENGIIGGPDPDDKNIILI